jgi:putative addiction module killer protein
MNYIIQQTESFVKWHESLRDLRARTAIARRIDRAEYGNLGDEKAVGSNVSEMRIDVGAGYRVYFTIRHGIVLILLDCLLVAINPPRTPILSGRLNYLRRLKYE